MALTPALQEALERMAKDAGVSADDLVKVAVQNLLRAHGYVQVKPVVVPELAEPVTTAAVRPTAPEGNGAPSMAPSARGEIFSATSPSAAVVEEPEVPPSRPPVPSEPAAAAAPIAPIPLVPPSAPEPFAPVANTMPSQRALEPVPPPASPPPASTPPAGPPEGMDGDSDKPLPPPVESAPRAEADEKGTIQNFADDAAAAIAQADAPMVDITAPRGSTAVARNTSAPAAPSPVIADSGPGALASDEVDSTGPQEPAEAPAVEAPAAPKKSKGPDEAELETLRAVAQKRIDEISSEVERWVKPGGSKKRGTGLSGAFARPQPSSDELADTEERKGAPRPGREEVPAASEPDPAAAFKPTRKPSEKSLPGVGKKGPVPSPRPMTNGEDDDGQAPTEQRSAVPPSSLKMDPVPAPPPAKEGTGKRAAPAAPVAAEMKSSENPALKPIKKPARDYDLPTRLKPEAEAKRQEEVEPADRTFIVSSDGPVSVFILYKSDNPKLVDTERFVIGRGDKCDMIINSVRVSREHVAVLKIGNDVFIEDLKSSNGTWFANQKVSKQKVSDGDEFLLGNEPVKFMLKKGFPGGR